MTTDTPTQTKDIVAIATESAKTLTSALKAASLVDTLKGKGPFTVLNYHVVSGKLKSSDLRDGQELTTVQGEKLKVSIKDKKVIVGGANVTGVDIDASNGVIHVIDKVLLPKI
jgi:uncharacterized surface protein with fasciclin (FAS1) repeats